MSLNLTLIFDKYHSKNKVSSYDRLSLDCEDNDCFDRIKSEAIPFPNGINWYDEEGLEHRIDDKYGNPLTFLTSHALTKHLSAAELHGFDTAILSLLKALPADTRVVLWWH